MTIPATALPRFAGLRIQTLSDRRFRIQLDASDARKKARAAAIKTDQEQQGLTAEQAAAKADKTVPIHHLEADEIRLDGVYVGRSKRIGYLSGLASLGLHFNEDYLRPRLADALAQDVTLDEGILAQLQKTVRQGSYTEHRAPRETPGQYHSYSFVTRA